VHLSILSERYISTALNPTISADRQGGGANESEKDAAKQDRAEGRQLVLTTITQRDVRHFCDSVCQ
jgi:hypothetical protein